MRASTYLEHRNTDTPCYAKYNGKRRVDAAVRLAQCQNRREAEHSGTFLLAMLEKVKLRSPKRTHKSCESEKLFESQL